MPITTAFQTTYGILMKLAFKLGSNLMFKFWQGEVLMKFTTPYLDQEWMTMDCAVNATFGISQRKRDKKVLATLVKEKKEFF
jgi:hypothetical protein